MTEQLARQDSAVLRRFVRHEVPTAVAPERCEFCSAPLAPHHRHLFEIAAHEIHCVCQACSILFDRAAASEGRYRLIEQQARFLPTFTLNDLMWAQLRLPVGLAFFFYSSAAARVMAYYPSPMGPTESLLPLEAWGELVDANPVLDQLTPDVMALLVNRAERASVDGRGAYLVSIDHCYQLVALLRSRWRGFSGGSEVWQAIDEFFLALKK